MKKILLLYLLSTIVIVFFLLNRYATPASPNPLIFEIADTVNHSRSNLYSNDWTEEELDLFQSYFTFDNVEVVDWKRLTTEPEAEDIRNKLINTEALEDVTALFSALRAAYGGYDYFGGDKAFNKIQADIIDEISEITAQGNSIRRYQLHSILVNHLSSIIIDGHFSIGKASIISAQQSFMYYVPDITFDSPNLVTGVLVGCVQPTVTASGQLVYGLYALSSDGTDLPTSAVISGKETILSWQKASDKASSTSSINSRQVKDGVPILTLPSFSPNNIRERNRLNEFASDGISDRQYPMLILDLRGNSGGDTSYSYSWLRNYLGTGTSPKYLRATRYSDFWVKTLEMHGQGFEDALQVARAKNGECLIASASLNMSENKNIIFVLTDKNTASAAESFIWKLRSVENVIIVGSNTSGTNSFGNIGSIFLPNSGYEIKFGITISLWESVDNVDGRGILPDLWVPPDKALDYILALTKAQGQENG